MTTIFEHNGKELYKDEADEYGVRPEGIETIRQHFGQFDKTLLTSTYTVIQADGDDKPQKVIFAKKTGTKGALWQYRVAGELGYGSHDCGGVVVVARCDTVVEAENEAQAIAVAKDVSLTDARRHLLERGLELPGWTAGPEIEALGPVSAHTVIERLGLGVVRASEIVANE